MKIGIDAREIENGVYTGIGRALFNFLEYFDRQTDENSIVLFSCKPLPFVFSSRISSKVLGSGWTFWWDQIVLANACRVEAVNVFYSPYYKIPLLASCPKVSAVLDLIYLQFDPYRRKMGLFKEYYYRVVARFMAHVSARVHTCSDFSRRDLISVYGVAQDKIAVIPLSVADIYQPLSGNVSRSNGTKSFGVPGRYLLYIGNFKAHKNVDTLLEAFAKVAARYQDLSLVLVGPQTDGYELLKQRVLELGLKERVIFPGKCTDARQLLQLYQGAEIFVMPSLYEGFGIPPAEAMACGTPVVCSKASSLPEVVGDAGLLVDPHDPQAFANAIVRILEEPALREELVRKGLIQSTRFRNEPLAARMYDLLKGAARG